RNPLIGPYELAILITQSGETADTTGALREAKKKGARTVAISNVVGSTIAREADGVLYTHAGKETSIASTKAFTAQMAALYLFALYVAPPGGRVKEEHRGDPTRQRLNPPKKVGRPLESACQCKQLARRYHAVEDFLFLGRAVHYPIAMDGALKLK